MSAGTIWYKVQPDSEIARAVSDLLSDFCGSIKSHDATVLPQKMVSLTAAVLSRSDTVIIVGGLDAISPEENTVFLLSKALGIPLEEGRRSRSRFVYDTLHSTRLPSLAGAVLFPSRFEGPEGMLLMSGQNAVIVLPSMARAAVTMAVSMRRFLAPYAAERKQAEQGGKTESLPEQKDYEKFRRSIVRKRQTTRVYTERQLQSVMERAVSGARRKSRAYPDVNCLREEEVLPEDDEYYRKRLAVDRTRHILSLLLVLGIVTAVIVVLGFLGKR